MPLDKAVLAGFGPKWLDLDIGSGRFSLRIQEQRGSLEARKNRLAKEAQAQNSNRDRQQLPAIPGTGDQFYTDSHSNNPP